MGVCATCGKTVSRKRVRCKSCSNRQRVYTEVTKNKMRDSKMGHKNPMWRGDSAGYFAIHEWVNNHKKKPDLCECCKKVPPFDLANISGEYKRDIDDWEYLCRKCHMVKDGRYTKVKSGLNRKDQP